MGSQAFSWLLLAASIAAEVAGTIALTRIAGAAMIVIGVVVLNLETHQS